MTPAQTPADQFSAVADPTRCRVIEMLSERAMPVHELTAAFSISRPAISRHLRVLKQAGLVKELKQGRENVYSLQRARLAPMLHWLERHGVAVPAAPARAAVRKPKVKVVVVAAPPKSAVPAPEPQPARTKSAARPVSKAPAAGQMQLDLF